MAEIKTALIAHFNNTPAVFAAFSNRITADKIPDGQAYPHARLLTIASPYRYSHNGSVGRIITVQIDVFDDDQAGADESTEIIRAACDGFKGTMGTVDAGRCFVKNVSGNWNEEARKYRRILEVEIGTND